MFHIVDKYLEVEGLSGDVTLYFNDETREFIALDGGLNWKRYKLAKEVTQLSIEQKQAILEYRLGVGSAFNAELDVMESDVFMHGEHVECIEVGAI